MHILNKPFNTLSKVLKELFNSIKLFRNETVPQFLQRIALGPPVSVLTPQPELHYTLLLQLLLSNPDKRLAVPKPETLAQRASLLSHFF
jgi:hypothetical protein